VVLGSRSHPYERGHPVMRAEQRGGGLRQRAADTRPYTERTPSVATKVSALHSVGVPVPLGQARKRPAFRGSGRRESVGLKPILSGMTQTGSRMV